MPDRSRLKEEKQQEMQADFTAERKNLQTISLGGDQRLNVFFDSSCSGGLRPPMGNDLAVIETPLQVKTTPSNLKPNSHWY